MPGTLTAQLLSNSSLGNQGTNFQTGFQFDSQTDRNIIGNAKLKNFSFNAGTGGTIVLGGANNGNGLLRVRDSSNGTIVTVDNGGILVQNGKIIIQNSAGGTVVDSSGIVSTTSFPSAQVFSNTLNQTASTSAIDLPGATLNSFVLTRATKVYVTMSAWGYNIAFFNNGHSAAVNCVDSVDGNLISYPVYGIWAVSNIDFAGSNFNLNVAQQPVTMGVIQQLSAGTHTIKLQYYANSAGTATISAFLLSYFILGA